jgi:hypothetical protein
VQAPLTHPPPHGEKPALQLKPHALFSHVAVALAGMGQGTHEVPQVVTDVSSAQVLVPQAW